MYYGSTGGNNVQWVLKVERIYQVVYNVVLGDSAGNITTESNHTSLGKSSDQLQQD